MGLNNVPAGKELPEDIYVIIEIPANADPIKYEVDKDSGALFVDRFMSTAMFYPCNYGHLFLSKVYVSYTSFYSQVLSFAAVQLAF